MSDAETVQDASKTRRKADAPETQAEATPQARRRPRASVGGFALKLDAPARPGFVRRFVNGDPSRIIKMQELGYTLVNDRAGEGSARTEGQGTRITRHAGKLEDGAPMQAVLMETPEEEYAYGLSDKEEHRQQFEDTIRRSADPTGQVEGSYVPRGQSTLTRSG